jgi:hypothetical protein
MSNRIQDREQARLSIYMSMNIAPDSDLAEFDALDDDSVGPADRSLVSVVEADERRYWAEFFGVAEQHLRLAVNTVGCSAEKIREYLRK